MAHNIEISFGNGINAFKNVFFDDNEEILFIDI